jgi:hypothetical protein
MLKLKGLVTLLGRLYAHPKGTWQEYSGAIKSMPRGSNGMLYL